MPVSGLTLLIVATLLSNARIAISYIFSLLAAISLGVKAGLDTRAEKVVIPVVDVLQSTPVMGFFPIAVYILVSLFPGWLGWEVASIFLVFTSQAWNMILGVYQSTKTLPGDLLVMSKVYDVSGLPFIRRIALPAAVPSLIYNSMVSWGGSWFFVTASEIISLGSKQHKLLGLGSMMADSAINADYGMLAASVAAMIASMLVVMLFVWNPLLARSGRYGFGPEARLDVYSVDVLVDLLSRISRRISDLLSPISTTATLVGKVVYETFRRILPALALLVAVWAIIVNASGITMGLEAIASPLLAISASLATLFTLGRLTLAYMISMAWILPLSLALMRRRHLYMLSLTSAEILSGIPATIWYPLVIIAIARYGLPPDLGAVLLLVTGMQWYIFFNAMCGIRSVPEEVETMSKVYGVKGRLYMRKVLLPAMLPYLVTGSNAGWGGAWNATIIAEYIMGRGFNYFVYGLGGLITLSTLKGEVAALVFYVIWMAAVVVLLNRTLWARLYGYVAEKVRVEV